MITADQIRHFAPTALPTILQAFTDLAADITAAGLIKPLRIQHFMTEIAVESAGLAQLEENLNYSATRLVQVWPKRFPTIAAATPYAHNPKALANKTYGGRLGNTQPNDGWDFRGSGLIGTTGRDNFRAAGHEADPDTLRQPVGALLSALKFWTAHGLNAIADADNLARIRAVVQGADLGLADAKIWRAKAARIFTA